MAIYEFRCAQHGLFEEQRTMGHVAPASCPGCGAPSPKIISLPQFQEDRRRFWRAADGSRLSAAFGGEAPSSRAEERAMCKMRGIEMTGPSELPHLRRAAEVGRAVRAGEKISSKEVVMHIDEPKAPPIPLAETLRKMGKQRAVAERAAVGFDNWSDRGAQSAAALAEKGRQVRHAGVAELRPANKAIDLT